MRSLFLLSLFSLLFLASGQVALYKNQMMIFNPPSSIPASGTFSAVVEYETNVTGLVNLHMDLSDITASYAYDGGAFAQVMGPSAGYVTMVMSLITGTTGVLNVGDSYQLHTYMTANADSITFGAGNDWQHTKFDAYNAVRVSSAPLPNLVSAVSVPSTMPNTGSFAIDVYWSSNLPGYTMIHMDFNDATQSYAWDGGASANVTSPGQGIVSLNLTIIGGPLNIGDAYNLRVYMTSGANSSQYGAGNDWQHAQAESNYGVKVAATTSLLNSLTIINPPTMIPPSGNFTVNCAWSTPYTGIMNLHLDISDITQSYAYDGGNMVQVNGPGSGVVSITVTITTTAAAADKMQLHTYMLDEITSQEYLTSAGNNDWAHPLFDAYYPVTQGIAVVIPYPNTVAIYQPPTTIPNSGVISAVIEWSSNSPVSTTIHMDLSDITQSYAWDGGVSIIVPSPGSGFVTLSLPIIGQLNTGDAYQLHVYHASYANTTLYGAGADWQHSSVDLYQPVVVSSAPLTNYMQLLNVPTTVPAAGTVQLEVFYTSNLANGTILHVDFSDVTANWQYETGSSVQVPSPGSGTVTITVTWPASLALKIGDTYNLHGYMTSLYNNTLYGSSNDWAHSSFDSYNTVQIANAATFPISLTPINPPATIPNQGNFTVQYAWSCNYTGEINLHVDLSDTSANWLFEGGSTVQVTSPGAGVVQFTISVGTNVLPLGDQFQLHAYVAPTSVGLQYGIGTDWQHTIYDGFTTVAAVLPSNGKLANSVTFISPPVIIPPTGSFTVTVAYTTNITTGVNVHVDMSDVTASWKYEGGAMASVMATSGTVTLTLTLDPTVTGTLNTGDFYYLQAYIASTVASNANGGNGSDWKIPLINAFTQVTVSSTPLVNSMIIINPPLVIANSGTERMLVQWTSPYSGALNLHLDVSDVTQNYMYEGGAMVQVIGPGSGIVEFDVALGSVAVKLGDNYTLHLFMTSAANSSAAGGTSNDWKVSAYDNFYSIQAATLTSFKNSLTLINPPSTVPGSGSFTVQCAWSLAYAGAVNAHVDLSDITQNYAYDGGAASKPLMGPGSGVFTVTVPISANMPYSDSYQIHVYMTTAANSSIYGPEMDWAHSFYDGYYAVGEAGSSSSSSSSKSLSGGAIAGIVIGVVVGVALLAVLCFFFVFSSSRGGKGSKMDDDRVSGRHARHEDEQSQVSSADVEMGETGETHSNA